MLTKLPTYKSRQRLTMTKPTEFYVGSAAKPLVPEDKILGKLSILGLQINQADGNNNKLGREQELGKWAVCCKINSVDFIDVFSLFVSFYIVFFTQ